MIKEEAIKWLDNLAQDIGQMRHQDLWDYAQAIAEISQMIDEMPEIVRCEDCISGKKQMGKYINTNDLELEVSHYLQCEKESEAITLEELKEITNRLPPADVVEVVRCEDCKKFRNAICRKFMICTDLTDYCSYGERRETE